MHFFKIEQIAFVSILLYMYIIIYYNYIFHSLGIMYTQTISDFQIIRVDSFDSFDNKHEYIWRYSGDAEESWYGIDSLFDLFFPNLFSSFFQKYRHTCAKGPTYLHASLLSLFSLVLSLAILFCFSSSPACYWYPSFWIFPVHFEF